MAPFLTEENLDSLQTVRGEYDELLASVVDRLASELGVRPGFRLKTVGTIVDKLKRESLRLSQMQDIAGARLVVADSRVVQDRTVEIISRLFDDARIVDRRASPSHGYRAVHVVVSIDRRLVEVQVRTGLQDLWRRYSSASLTSLGAESDTGNRPKQCPPKTFTLRFSTCQKALPVSRTRQRRWSAGSRVFASA